MKILAITPEGKINLSVKQALPKPERPERPTRRESAPRRRHSLPLFPPSRRSRPSRISSSSLWSVSDSKQSELNRYMAGKRGGSRRRK